MLANSLTEAFNCLIMAIAEELDGNARQDVLLDLSPEIVERAQSFDDLESLLDHSASTVWQAEYAWEATAPIVKVSLEQGNQGFDALVDKIIEHNVTPQQVPASLLLAKGARTVGDGARERRRKMERYRDMATADTWESVRAVRTAIHQGEPVDKYRAKYLERVRQQMEDGYKGKLPDEVIEELTPKISASGLTIFDDYSPLYREYFDGIATSMQSIYTFMLLSPESEVAKYVDWLESSPSELSITNLPLLIALANDVSDKSGGNYFGRLIDALRNEHVSFDVREDFIEYSLGIFDEDEFLDNSNFASLRLARAVHVGDDDEFKKKLLQVSEVWDEGLVAEYKKYKNRLLDMVVARIEKQLEPFVRRSRFNVFQHTTTRNRLDVKQPKARKKARPGRVTPKKRNQEMMEAERERDIETETIVEYRSTKILKKIPGGYLVEPAGESEVHDLLEDYCSHNGRDESLLEDLYAMLQSIYEKPAGNGATPYTGAKINVGDKPRSLMHLSPNHRQGLSLKTSAGNRTRIVYLVLPADGGGYDIAIEGVYHKNEIDNHGTTFTRKLHS